MKQVILTFKHNGHQTASTRYPISMGLSKAMKIMTKAPGLYTFTKVK